MSGIAFGTVSPPRERGSAHIHGNNRIIRQQRRILGIDVDADEISRRSICDGVIDTPLFFQTQRGVIRIHRSNGKAKVVDVILILPFYIDASRFIEAENASPVFFVIVVLFDSPYSEVAIIDRQEIRETLPFRQSEYFFAIMQVVYLD